MGNWRRLHDISIRNTLTSDELLLLIPEVRNQASHPLLLFSRYSRKLVVGFANMGKNFLHHSQLYDEFRLLWVILKYNFLMTRTQGLVKRQQISGKSSCKIGKTHEHDELFSLIHGLKWCKSRELAF